MLSSAHLPLTHHWVVQSISFSSSWRYVRCRLRFSTKNQSNLPIHAILRQNRCWMILQQKAMSDLYAWSGYILLLSWVVLSWFVELLFQLITRDIMCRRHVHSKRTTALHWINYEFARCHIIHCHEASINGIHSVDYWSAWCNDLVLLIRHIIDRCFMMTNIYPS